MLAAKLAGSGACGHLLVVPRRPGQAGLLNAEGISLHDNDSVTKCPVSAVAWPDYVSGERDGEADAVFLAVKQRHLTADMADAVARRLAPRGIVVAWMNGIGHEQLLAASLGKHRSALAVTTEAALDLGETAVRHTGAGWTKLGMLETGAEEAAETLQNVEKCLSKAGIAASLSNDIMQEAWNKLVINSVINPLTAIYGIPNGDLPASPRLRHMMRNLFLEAKAVAACAGITIDDSLWDRLVEVCKSTARNRSSMLQDIAAGKKSEIDWINGSLIRTAERHGIPVPANRSVYDAVRGLENNRD